MAPVGVPGLILGGGISHFSSKLGWACDNVASFELVTASGLVLNVTPNSYPDLYWALRGGGNNFGIVTNFKLFTFPLGQMWGGQRIYLENTFPSVLDAIHQFTIEGSSKDADAAQIVVCSRSSIGLRCSADHSSDVCHLPWYWKGCFRKFALRRANSKRICI